MTLSTNNPPRYLTHAQLVDLLASRKGDRSLDEFARDIHISPSFLSNIFCGHRRVDEKVMRYLGVRKLTMYVYVREDTRNGKEST